MDLKNQDLSTVMDFYPLLKILAKIALLNRDKNFFIKQKNLEENYLKLRQKEQFNKHQKQQLTSEEIKLLIILQADQKIQYLQQK